MSTRCSTARGPARSPSLVTCPTRRSGTPLDFARRVRRSTQARTWARLPAGCARSGSETDWSESTTTRAGRWRPTAHLDRLDVGPLECEEVPGHRAHPRRPPAHLCERLLGRGEHDVDASGGDRREHLEQERGLADARRAEQEGDGAPDHAAPHDPVELAHAGGQRAGPVGRDVTQRDGGRGVDGAVLPGRCTRTDAGPSVFHSPQFPHRPTQRNDVVPHAVQT